MYIFVDEAGTFQIPERKQNGSISCVGALGIPEDDLEDIYSGFVKLKMNWGSAKGEIKGSKLDERQVKSLIAFLKEFDLIFEVVAIDMALQTHKGIIKHRMIQAEKLTANLTNKHNTTLINQLNKTKEQLIKLKKSLKLSEIF